MWERISVPSTDWNEKSRAEEWRKGWADVCNKYLKGKARVDHRSYARQGKKQLPTIHEGYVTRKIAKRGKQSTIIDYNVKVKRTNDYSQATEQDLQAVEDELKQLVAELEKLKSEQKGQKRNELNERIKQLRERARRIDTPDGANADNEREIASRTERTATEIFSATTTEQPTGNTDTDTLIRQAEAVGASAKANVASSTASRADREAERERQAAFRSQQEAERRRAEEERKRQSIKRGKKSL